MPTLVQLVPHDPSWPQKFRVAEERLRGILMGQVLTVDHIGSTAVPGMSAKPLIDIDVTLTDFSAISGAGLALVNAGFEARGNRYDDDMWAFLWKSSLPALRVYLCAPENQTHRLRLLFRDFLRQHSDTAAEYTRLKHRLALEFPYDGDRYTTEKSDFVRRVIETAIAGDVSLYRN
ncbi:GrpB-like predicted nucleotidyltransferase (UPF0157 family) [Rhizobium aquaticum]|uniref:GrpB-like predicted nucleotidyltransferase (UPF0157 family) n=1 Tax=Rhizobium aquaticum TaxID=1549636 RepID=A0ABV2IZ53_9HYPH